MWANVAVAVSNAAIAHRRNNPTREELLLAEELDLRKNHPAVRAAFEAYQRKVQES